MINSRPNNKHYTQGNYLPVNRDKVIKFNAENGVYFRSSWERKVMIWLDHCDNVKRWGAECMEIPYQTMETNEINHRYGDMTAHRYYPDFYYEIEDDDKKITRVVVEVKPQKEVDMTNAFLHKTLTVPEKSRALKNFEYDFKTAYKNAQKWNAIIKYCDKMGYEFVIMTETYINKINI